MKDDSESPLRPLTQNAYQPHLCECGCGHPTHKIRQTKNKFGRVKGEYSRYLYGHRGKTAEEGILYERSLHYVPLPKKRSLYQWSTRDRQGRLRNTITEAERKINNRVIDR